MLGSGIHGKCVSRTFLSLQKVLLDGSVLKKQTNKNMVLF